MNHNPEVLYDMRRMRRSWWKLFTLVLWMSGLGMHLQIQAQNGLLREVYAGLSAGTLNALTNHPSFPANPSSSGVIPEFEAPSDVGNLYGQRVRGYLVPPQTGPYVFWIASDDGSILFLSKSEDPGWKAPIASVNGWTSFREWEKETNQRSAPIFLEQGKRYYVEALMAEGSGGDHLSVRWRLPDGTVEEPIPENRLLVESIPPQISRAPGSIRVVEGERAVFSVEVSNLGPVRYQWERNGVAVEGATSAVYERENVGLNESGDRYRVVVENAFGTAASSEAVLQVDPDVSPPALVSVLTPGASDIVTVIFSEGLEASSATNRANYKISPGVEVLEARLGPDGRTVILKTSPLVFGMVYRLTVSSVRDRASQGNAIDPGSWKEFTYGYAPLSMDRLKGRAETLGASSRRTGLVISEIMYHPPERSDQRNLQFIEIYNSQLVGENLGGYRLSGAVEFTFPPGTFLPPESFLVMAPAPGDVQAVYGLPRVLGGFEALRKGAGTIRLHNAQGAVLLEAEYDSAWPWPTGAAGAGHSLVLAKPSYGERDRAAWEISAFFGGSPGRLEPEKENRFRTVMINEFLAHTDDPQLDFIELYNYSAAPVDLSGCVLTDNPARSKFRIPEGTVLPPLGFVAFDQNELGFALSASGERILLIDPGESFVIDAIRFEAQANGISAGRFPDGGPDFQALERPTPGEMNARPWRSDVIINEIMYHPISGDDDDEFIELYNRGAAPVDLSGWQLDDGIRFSIPVGTMIAADGYLVIARNAERLRANYPQLTAENTVGNFSGRLSNSGERIALLRPEQTVALTAGNVAVTNTIYILVNEVNYRDGGRWGKWADGGGSSLELIDPESDNRLPSNWADSDESVKASWTPFEHTGLLDHGNTNYPAATLQILMLEAGDCLIDQVEVIDASQRNLVVNGTFEVGTRGWFMEGNHSGSGLQSGDAFDGRHSLKVTAPHRGDTGPNRIRTRLAETIPLGSRATLRARGRWLRGHPEVLLRLHGNHLEAVGRLDIPKNLGTPGLPNSRKIGNAGPAIERVSHAPILPAAQQQALVSARITDPDAIAAVRLFYRVDPATNFTATPMVYNGAGYYSGTIPGQSAGKLAAFYVEAADSRGAAARFPDSAPARECLVLFGERKPQGKIPTYRFWITESTIEQWSKRHRGTNARNMDATFVYGEDRVIYNASADYSGSPFHWGNYNSPLGNNCNYALVFPKDDLLLGEEDFILNMPANLGSDNTAIREQIVFWMAQEMGHVFNHRRFHHLYINGVRRGNIFEDAQQPNRDFVKQWFPEDADGELYKIEDWFEFNDVSSGFRNVDATLENFVTANGGKKVARYRWNWRKRAVGNSANDFSRLLDLVDAVNTPGAAYTSAVENLIDVDQWMSVMALRHIVGDWDSYGYRRGKNMYAYKPENGKWRLMHWDAAFALGLGHGTTHDLFDARTEPVIERMLNHPPFRRAYLRALQNAANGPMAASRVNPVIDARSNALIANGVFVSSPETVKQWISSRRNYILSQLSAVSTSFSVTSHGEEFSTNRNQITLTGTAPVEVTTIRVNGVAYPVTWNTVRDWTMRYALPHQSNTLRIEGYDAQGRLVPGSSVSLNATFTGAAEAPEHWLAINEIHYAAPMPGAEFIELHNASSLFAFDLSNYRLRGVNFTFPEGTLIQPEGYLVIAADADAFAAVYGRSIPLAGVYPGRLRPEGETLRLVRPDPETGEELLVSAVSYSNQLPWPAEANGTGGSLQLIDPLQDISRVGNWMALSGVATPGKANSQREQLPPFPEIRVNELQPHNVSGIRDHAGERDPWLELYNAGAVAVELAGFFLTNDYADPMRWPFPAGAILGPGQFKIVWLDGQPEQSSSEEWHASFRPHPVSGAVALVRMQNNRPAVVDYINYQSMQSDRSVGLFPDGAKEGEGYFFTPTPGDANTLAAPEVRVFINEWMASNGSTLANPADGQFDDWFELYNPGASAIDLSGYTLSDKLDDPARFVIPRGTIIPARGFLLVWADDKPANNGRTGFLHVNFKLERNGEAIGLYAPDGRPVDVVVFGEQARDASQGRFPDGAPEPFVFMARPTPGGPNQAAGLVWERISREGIQVTLTWQSEPDRIYQIQYKANLLDAEWIPLLDYTATSTTSSVMDEIGANESRFYRVIYP